MINLIDIEKLKYDLAMNSALAMTIMNRNSKETLATQMLKEFMAAYNEYALMPSEEFIAVKNSMANSKQLNFEKVNSLGKRNI